MQATQTNLDITNDRYQLKRIVYVNSATHGYSEIEIDKHMALFGHNNRGKTASLAGLKLALFPETSFTHCEKKFRFLAKSGRCFSKEDSYNFYFPSYESYIITEIENPRGQFCMVLYKSRGEWEYGRVFVPAGYDLVRPVFWDDEQLALQQELQFKDVFKCLKDLDGKLVNNTTEIARLLFAGHMGSPEDGRFCMLPLLDNASPAALEAFKNLYQLAFDTGQTDKQTLPKAIATIVEMKRGRSEERLDAKLDSILADYDELSKQNVELQGRKNSEPEWELLRTKYDVYRSDKKAFVDKVSAINVYLNDQLQEFDGKIELINDQLQEQQAIVDSAQKNFDDIKIELASGQGVLKSKSADFEKVSDNYNKSSSLISSYKKLSVRDIEDILRESIEGYEEKIAAYESDEKIQERLSKCIAEKNALIEESKSIKNYLDSIKPQLLDELPLVDASIVNSINVAFSTLSKKEGSDDVAALMNFSSCFERQADGLLFFGERIEIPFVEYDKEKVTSIKCARLEDVTEMLLGLDKDIGELKFSLGNSHGKNENIRIYRKELEDAQKELQLLLYHEANKAHCDKLKIEIAELAERVAKLTEVKEKSEQWLLEQSGKLQNITRQQQELRYKKTAYFDWGRQLHIILETTKVNPILECEKILESLTKEDMDELLKSADNLKRLRNEIIQQARMLGGAIDVDVDVLFRTDITDDQLRELIQSFYQIYNELRGKIELYEKAVFTHNQNISSQMQELREARETLVKFVADLNADVNRNKISNLQEVKLHLVLNSKFEDLLSDVKKYDLMREYLLDRGFYERINAFCQEFFVGANGRNRRINLEKLIDGIQYHYKIDGTDTFQTKDQSEGTTSTTTALVLAMLLKKISPSFVSVGIPIILDEIAKLDVPNKKAAIRTIAEHGFAVFCATPQPEASVMECVGRWLIIDQSYLEVPRVANCNAMLLPRLVQSFGV